MGSTSPTISQQVINLHLGEAGAPLVSRHVVVVVVVVDIGSHFYEIEHHM